MKHTPSITRSQNLGVYDFSPQLVPCKVASCCGAPAGEEPRHLPTRYVCTYRDLHMYLQLIRYAGMYLTCLGTYDVPTSYTFLWSQLRSTIG